MHTHLAPQMVFEHPHHCLVRSSFPVVVVVAVDVAVAVAVVL